LKKGQRKSGMLAKGGNSGTGTRITEKSGTDTGNNAEKLIM